MGKGQRILPYKVSFYLQLYLYELKIYRKLDRSAYILRKRYAL